jgi:hypothetical protein
MKDHTQLQPNTSFALALIGEPFTRKSSVAFQFPSPLFFDCDRKLSNVVEWYPQCRPFYFVEPDLDMNTGKELPPGAKWNNLLVLVNRFAMDPRSKVLVFDSMSRISDYLCDHIVTQGGPTKDLVVGGEKVMTMQMWYPYKELLTRFIVQVRSAGKPCIFTFHERTDKDEVSGVLVKQPNIGGQLRDNVAKLFTDVWRTQIKPVPIDATHPSGIAYVVRTEPTNLIAQLGHSRPLPHEFEFSWSIVEKAYPFLANLKVEAKP